MSSDPRSTDNVEGEEQPDSVTAKPVTTTTLADRRNHEAESESALGSQTPNSCDSCEDNISLSPSGNAVLSKSQQKKMKKREKWLAIKAEKRAEEKKRRKRKLAEAREKGVDIGPSRKSLKRNQMANSSCRIRAAIDCSFDEFMSEKDVAHMVQQLQHSYAANRRAANPLQFYVCGITGKTKERLESIGDYHGWDIYVKEESYDKVFDKDSIVYLSSESPNVLERLQEDKVYIIGGLVDHNHQKGLCHRLALEKGISHAQLPLSDHLMMKSRKVLTINHVFEILLRYTETGDWQKSLLSVLPQRKNVVARTSADTSSGTTSGTSAVPEGSPAAESQRDAQASPEGGESNSAGSDRTASHTLPALGES